MRHFSQFLNEFHGIFGGLGTGSALHGFRGNAWTPPIDVYEAESGFIIVAELPGFDKEALEVQVEQNTLSISGERAQRIPDGARHVHQMEIPCGRFARHIRLPEDIAVDAIDAEYKEGYLIIRLPRVSRE